MDRTWSKICAANLADEAELLAVEFGISMPLEQGLSEIEVLSDSQNTKKALAGKSHSSVWTLLGVFL